MAFARLLLRIMSPWPRPSNQVGPPPIGCVAAFDLVDTLTKGVAQAGDWGRGCLEPSIGKEEAIDLEAAQVSQARGPRLRGSKASTDRGVRDGVLGAKV